MKQLLLMLVMILSFTVAQAKDNYRVTAQTQNQTLDNYWVDLVVEADRSYYGTTIYGVYYDDGYGLKSLTKHVAPGYAEGTYYVWIDGDRYYFTFK